MTDRRTRRTPARTLALAMLLATVTACGTTVQQTGTSASGAVDQFGQPLAPGTADSSLGSGQVGAPGTTAAAGSGIGAAPGAISQGTSNTSATAPVGATGTSRSSTVTAKNAPVEVGFFITTGVDKLFGSLGYDGLNPGNQERQVNALVKEVNATGGFAGHKIVPIFGVWDATKGNTVTQREAACAKWTQDHHVVAAVGESFDTFMGCSNKNRLPMLFGNPFPFTQEQMNTVPFMGTPTVPVDERMHPAWVDTLFAAGYFKPVTALPLKLGVVYADTPPQARSVKKNLEPALNRRGIKVTAWGPISTKSAQELEAAIQSTVLRFRADGITHVVIVDTGGAGLLFMPQAESQGFRPRYGLHSWSKPAQIQGQVPAEQLRNSIGGGWNPSVDVDNANRPKDNAAAARCLKLMRAAGENTNESLARESVFLYCDSTFTLQQMANRAGSFDPQKMIAALKTLGPDYQVAGSPYADFTGRRDAPAGMRTFHFVFECTCFRYTSAPVRRF